MTSEIFPALAALLKGSELEMTEWGKLQAPLMLSVEAQNVESRRGGAAIEVAFTCLSWRRWERTSPHFEARNFNFCQILQPRIAVANKVLQLRVLSIFARVRICIKTKFKSFFY